MHDVSMNGRCSNIYCCTKCICRKRCIWIIIMIFSTENINLMSSKDPAAILKTTDLVYFNKLCQPPPPHSLLFICINRSNISICIASDNKYNYTNENFPYFPLFQGTNLQKMFSSTPMTILSKASAA